MVYPVYYDADADLYRYVVQDTVTPKSDWYEMTVQHSFALRNSRISGRLLTYEADNFPSVNRASGIRGAISSARRLIKPLWRPPIPI